MTLTNQALNETLGSFPGRGVSYNLMAQMLAKDGPMHGAPNMGLPTLNDVLVFHDDFVSYVEGTMWTTTEDGDKSGTDGIMDEVGGIYQNFCDGDANDESYVISNGEFFKFATDKKMWFEARLRVDEGNTDDANVIVGLMDNAGANALQDTGAGPAASYDGAVFFKVKDGTKWQFETSNAGSQVTSETLADYEDDTMIRLGFYFDGVSKITPYVNGTEMTDNVHTITLAGLEEMHVFFGIKTPGTHEESVEIDYITCIQLK